MKEKPVEKPRQQGDLPRSRSLEIINSKVSHSNSLRSQIQINKLPCQSHCFEMRPLSSTDEAYYQQRLQFFFTHEQKESRPYPVILRQFGDIEYLPIFGNETQIQVYRKHKNKYRASFYQQKSKASFDDQTKKDLTTPVPKHKYCQICKIQFQVYEKHIFENIHIKNMKQSYGSCVIDEFIEDYLDYRQNDKQINEFIFLRRLMANIKESSLMLKSQLKNYSHQLYSYSKIGRK